LHAVTRRMKRQSDHSDSDSDINEGDEGAEESRNADGTGGVEAAVDLNVPTHGWLDSMDSLDKMLARRYATDSQESISHESYFRGKKAGGSGPLHWRLGTLSTLAKSNAIQGSFKQLKDMREKNTFRRRSVLFHTTSLAQAKTYEKGNTRRSTPKTSKENAGLDGTVGPGGGLESMSTSFTDGTYVLGEDSASSKEAFVDAIRPKKKITDPYDPEYEDEGEVDAEWAEFRMHLQLVNEHDRAMQRIAADEQARRDEEIRKQNEDAIKFKETREEAEAAEVLRKLAKEAAVAAAAQAANDQMLAAISLDRQLLNTPHMNVRSSASNAHFDNLPRAYVIGSAKDGDEAVDEASQFDITFTERYELDSFFAASAAASIASEMSAEELVYVAANAASTAARKAMEAAELAAKANSRVLKMQESFAGYEDLQALKALKREQEKALLRQEMDTITGSSSKISIKRLKDLHKRQMEDKIKELAENRVRDAKDTKKKEVLSSSISAGEAAIKSRESSPSPASNKNKNNKRKKIPTLSQATHTTLNDSLEINTLSGLQETNSVGIISQVTGTDFDFDGSSVTSSEVGGTFDLTEFHIPDQIQEGDELFGVSHAGSSIIDDYAGGSYTPKELDREQNVSEQVLLEKRKTAVESKQFPFPHKSYYSIIKKTAGEMSDGQLGSWNHERAVKLNLLARAGNIVEEDFEKMQMSLVGESTGKSLEIKARPLPWFATEVKLTRGKTGQTSMEKQRSLMQPGDLRFFKEEILKVSPVKVNSALAIPRGAESVAVNQNLPTELDELSQILSVNADAGSEKLTTNVYIATDNHLPDAIRTPQTLASTQQPAAAEVGILDKMRIKQNNDFIAKMVLAAGITKVEEPKLLVEGTLSAFKGFDAKPVIDAKAFGKFVDLPHSVEKQSSPIHPNRGFLIPNKFVDKTVYVQNVSPSAMTRSEFHHATSALEYPKSMRDVRSPTADAVLRIALGTTATTTTSPARTPLVTKMTQETIIRAEKKGEIAQEAMTDAIMSFGSVTVTIDKPNTPNLASVAKFEKSRDAEIASLSLRSYQRFKTDSTGVVLIACNDKTMSAAMSARADPVGPASTFGADSIEEHPRFRYSGLPAPLQPAPTRYSSNMTNLKLMKKKTGVIHEPEFIPDLNLNISSRSASSDPPFWLPKAVKCLNDPMYHNHDRSSHINGWNDLREDIKSRNPNADAERANVMLTLKRQQAYLTRFTDYVTTTKARNSNAEFINFVNKDIPVLTEGNKKALNNFYDKYKLPLAQERVAVAERRRQAFQKKRNDLEALEFA